jgi:hypothetical protein
VTKDPLRALAFLRSLGASGMPSNELDHAPRALRETLLFPYQEGILWTRNLHQRGGWNEVSEAFTTLPQSSEQIMHAEKYFAHEAPVKVALPDIGPILNHTGRVAVRSVPPAAGGSGTQLAWKELDTDVNGEWGFYLILDQFLKSPAESHRAAAGWGGDRYSIYEGPKGEVLYTSLSTWDTENDAREFFDAYVRRTHARYASATPMEQTPNTGSQLLSKTFHTSQGTVTIERRGARVLVLEGIPDQMNSNSIAKSLW